MCIVSVIISSYNSANFIIDTLESVSHQTWKELELIITDDCSQDNTVEICNNWIYKNIGRFVNVEILRSEMNTGIAANANRGLKRSKGNWIKFLGADDCLEPDCINNNMKFIRQNSDVKVLFSRMKVYNNTFEKANLAGVSPEEVISEESVMWPERTAYSQYCMLLVCDRIHFTPTVFISRNTILSVGGFDERFWLLEDYPLWLNLTRNGFKLFYMGKSTVNYRRHSMAVNNNDSKAMINPNYFRSENFRRIYTYPYLPIDLSLLHRYNWVVQQIFRPSFMNRTTWYNKAFLKILTIYLNPFKYLIFIRKLINKKLVENDFYR